VPPQEIVQGENVELFSEFESKEWLKNASG